MTLRPSARVDQVGGFGEGLAQSGVDRGDVTQVATDIAYHARSHLRGRVCSH